MADIYKGTMPYKDMVYKGTMPYKDIGVQGNNAP